MDKNLFRNLGIIVVIIFVAIVFVIISYLPVRYGIATNCDEQKIVGFRRVNPPLMCMACITCDVEVIVKSQNNTIVCNNTVRGQQATVVVPCENLANYKNESLTVKAIFYYTNGTLIKTDESTLIFNSGEKIYG